MSNLILIENAASAELAPAPIMPDWIVAGAPKARNRTLATSKDRTQRTVVWECTAGCFNWHFSEDETICIVFGEVVVVFDDGEERRLGQGDVAFFPAGGSCMCRIDHYVRKVAVLRKDLPPLFSFGVKVRDRLRRSLASKARDFPRWIRCRMPNEPIGDEASSCQSGEARLCGAGFSPNCPRASSRP